MQGASPTPHFSTVSPLSLGHQLRGRPWATCFAYANLCNSLERREREQASFPQYREMNNVWDAKPCSSTALSPHPSAWPLCRAQLAAYREMANEGLRAVSLGPIPSVVSTTDMKFVHFKDLINAGVSGSTSQPIYLWESKTT